MAAAAPSTPRAGGMAGGSKAAAPSAQTANSFDFLPRMSPRLGPARELPQPAGAVEFVRAKHTCCAFVADHSFICGACAVNSTGANYPYEQKYVFGNASQAQVAFADRQRLYRVYARLSRNRRLEVHKRIAGRADVMKLMGFKHTTPFDINALGICLTKIHPGRLHGSYTSQFAPQKMIHRLATFVGTSVQWEKCRTCCSHMPSSSRTTRGYDELFVGLHGDRRDDACLRHDARDGMVYEFMR